MFIRRYWIMHIAHVADAVVAAMLVVLDEAVLGREHTSLDLYGCGERFFLLLFFVEMVG